MIVRTSNLALFSFVALTLAACEKPATDTTGKTPNDPAVQGVAIESKHSTDSVQSSEGQETLQAGSATVPKKELTEEDFFTIEWTDLLPPDLLEILLNPPDYITDIEDGSIEDRIGSDLESTMTAGKEDDLYQQALVSTEVLEEYDGQAVRIAGFIVPLEFNDHQEMTEFFLVPYFGACIHVPPPPPNQLIFVTHPDGLEVDTWVPYWISGVLKTQLVQNDIATAAYSMELHEIVVYDE